MSRTLHLDGGARWRRLARAEERAKLWVLCHWPLFLAVLLLGLALAIRLAVVPFQSTDYNDYFQKWFTTLASSPGLTALGQSSFSDYTPPYLYLLKLGSLVAPSQPLWTVKAIPACFDLLLAALVALVVRRRYRHAPALALAAGALILFSPTVLLDGAVWGQPDSIYTAFLVLCLWCVLTERNLLAFLAFGLAFAFKAQALFLLPLLVVVYFRRRVSVLAFALIPGAYLLLMVPAVLSGVSWQTTLTVYLRQANYYQQLALNAPTVFAWVPDRYYAVFLPFGIAWALAAGLGLISLALLSRRALTPDGLLLLALSLLLLVPYLSPAMHDRYFYPADVFSLIYAFYQPRRFYLPVLVTLCSLLSYLPFLFDQHVVPEGILALGMLLPISLVLYDYVRNVHARPDLEHSSPGPSASDEQAPPGGPSGRPVPVPVLAAGRAGQATSCQLSDVRRAP